VIYSSKPEPVFHTDCVREWQQAVNKEFQNANEWLEKGDFFSLPLF